MSAQSAHSDCNKIAFCGARRRPGPWNAAWILKDSFHFYFLKPHLGELFAYFTIPLYVSGSAARQYDESISNGYSEIKKPNIEYCDFLSQCL